MGSAGDRSLGLAEGNGEWGRKDGGVGARLLLRPHEAVEGGEDFAVVRSSYVALRSSVSRGASLVRFERISWKVEDLMLRLDSVEEDDPMISEGKRSIAGDLDRFLRYVDKRGEEVRPARSDRGRRNESSSRKDNGRREMVNDLRGRVERIREMSRVLEREERADDAGLEESDDFSDLEEEKGGVLITGRKSVKFAENGDACKVIRNSDEQGSTEGEDDSGDDSVDDLDKFKKHGGEGRDKSGGSYSDGGNRGRNDSVMKKKKEMEL